MGLFESVLCVYAAGSVAVSIGIAIGMCLVDSGKLRQPL